METVYNESALCPKCNRLMNPVEVLYSGATSLCVSCRNKEYAKQAKSAMGGNVR